MNDEYIGDTNTDDSDDEIDEWRSRNNKLEKKTAFPWTRRKQTEPSEKKIKIDIENFIKNNKITSTHKMVSYAFTIIAPENIQCHLKQSNYMYRGEHVEYHFLKDLM